MDDKEKKEAEEAAKKAAAANSDGGEPDKKNDEGKRDVNEAEREIGRSPMVEEAKKQADRISDENDRTEKLQKKQEELNAEAALGGRSSGGGNSEPQFSEEEKASRARIKAVGDSSGSEWAKKYE